MALRSIFLAFVIFFNFKSLVRATAPLNLVENNYSLAFHKEVLSLRRNLKTQIRSLFEQLKKRHYDQNKSIQLVHEQMENDLQLIHPSLQKELKFLTEKVIDEIIEELNQNDYKDFQLDHLDLKHEDFPSSKNLSQELNELQMSFKNKKSEKTKILNFIRQNTSSQNFNFAKEQTLIQNEPAKNFYTTTEKIIEDLTSSNIRENWFHGATSSYVSDTAYTTSTKIKLQLSVNYMGVKLDLGPEIDFNLRYGTNARVQAKGISSFLDHEGNFNFLQNDGQNRPMNFNCEASLDFETAYKGGGGFSFMGVGSDISLKRSFRSSVNIRSSTVPLPNYLDNKIVNVRLLENLCHKKYLKACSSENDLNVEENLYMTMTNLTKSLTFHHERTNCARDFDCNLWYRKNVNVLHQVNTTPRCVTHPKEKYQYCLVVGKKGSSCHVIENGQVTSSGLFEYTCDKGLRCQKIKDQVVLLGNKIVSSQGRCVPE